MLGVTGFHVYVVAVVMVLTAAGWLVRRQRWAVRRPVGRKLLVILGSGGHTGELLKFVRVAYKEYRPVAFVAAESDPLSMEKAHELEESRGWDETTKYVPITRFRSVGEPLIYACLRFPKVLRESIRLVWIYKPDVILCNGPGTCVPICIVAWFMKYIKILKVQIVFIESICRVENLSLTGTVLVNFVDDFVVQWEELKAHCARKYPWRTFLCWGRLT